MTRPATPPRRAAWLAAACLLVAALLPGCASTMHLEDLHRLKVVALASLFGPERILVPAGTTQGLKVDEAYAKAEVAAVAALEQAGLKVAPLAATTAVIQAKVPALLGSSFQARGVAHSPNTAPPYGLEAFSDELRVSSAVVAAYAAAAREVQADGFLLLKLVPSIDSDYLAPNASPLDQNRPILPDNNLPGFDPFLRAPGREGRTLVHFPRVRALAAAYDSSGRLLFREALDLAGERLMTMDAAGPGVEETVDKAATQALAPMVKARKGAAG